MTLLGKSAACLALLTLTAPAAWANCNPPYQTLLSCKILNSERRVEFCRTEIPDSSGPGTTEAATYNLTSGLGPAELYFETKDLPRSSKYWGEASWDEAPATLMIGLSRGDYIYAALITTSLDGPVSSAQIHVYESLKDFESIKGETDLSRLYCDPATIHVDREAFLPG